MSTLDVLSIEVEQAVRNAVGNLVRHEKVNGRVFINLPMIYPSGSYVTVRIDQAGDRVRVSDGGFAYREAEELDAVSRYFRRTANKTGEQMGVEVGDRALYVDASIDTLHQAICDVAEASWRVADHINFSLEEDDGELIESLTKRLAAVFGDKNVDSAPTITGASTNPWPVSAIVKLRDHSAVFQAVSGSNANSVYRTSTAFRDLAELDNPPRLIAVVKSKAALGARLSLLEPGRVIEEDQPDDLFVRAAA